MSGYFDDATREVREVWEGMRCSSQEHVDAMGKARLDEQFIQLVGDIENRIIKEVNLDTGDREFPEDLRERIQTIIAVWNINWPTRPESIPAAEWHAKGREWLLTLRLSNLIDRLHDAYHDVARRRIKTRFGLLFDSPSGNVSSRKSWEDDRE